MTRSVLDSSAVLALLNDEPGADAVAGVLTEAIISTVNVAEVISKLVERGSSLEQAKRALQTIGIQAVDFTVSLAERTGAMRLASRKRGLSLGDRACLALAQQEGIVALTCDRNWLEAIAGVDVRLIR
jgi:ribonuclease VapC